MADSDDSNNRTGSSGVIGTLYFNDLTITADGNDAVIDTGEGNGTIVLEGVTDLGTLTDEDFIFADPPPADDMGDSM